MAIYSFLSGLLCSLLTQISVSSPLPPPAQSSLVMAGIWPLTSPLSPKPAVIKTTFTPVCLCRPTVWTSRSQTAQPQLLHICVEWKLTSTSSAWMQLRATEPARLRRATRSHPFWSGPKTLVGQRQRHKSRKIQLVIKPIRHHRY